MPPITPKGYADGKRAAEAAAKALVDSAFGAVVLKPGGEPKAAPPLRSQTLTRLSREAIYGTRYAGTTPIPLWLALAPVSAAMRRLPGAAAHAPVSVARVAAAAVEAALAERFRGAFTVIENEELLRGIKPSA